jgi:hypothetical protein
VLNLLKDNPWIAPLVWALLYTSDYSLTLVCARLYRGQERIVFEGSYEITPIFQSDINALRLISRTFMFFLVVSTAYLALLSYWMRAAELRGAYLMAFGAMALTELTVHVRHLRNLFLFRGARLPNALRGRIEYSRGLLLRASAFELFLFSCLYAFLFLATIAPFILGGALACAALSLNHYRLARRHESARLKAV